MFVSDDINAAFIGKYFLIVDDFQGMRTLMREMLKTFGVKNIDTVTNGLEAIASLEKNKYDVVLCDFNLGTGKNGQQILEEAKHRDLVGLSTAWVIITAEKTADMVFGAAEYMPDDYILKPVNEATMRSRLEKVIARKTVLANIEKAMRAKNHARVVALCDELMASNKTSATELLRIKTGTLLAMGQYDQAKQVFEQILAKRDIPWAKTGLGKVAYYKNDMDRAQQLFREVINQNPAYLEAHDWLAKCHEAAGELEEAQRVLVRSTELSPHSVLRQKNLGELAHKRGDMETAEKAFRRTIKLGEFSVHKSPGAYLGLAKVCSSKNNPAEALQILKNVTKEFESSETAMHAKVVEGLVYREAGDHVNAGKISKEVAELVRADDNKGNPGMMLEAAQLFLATGNKEAAENLAKSVVRNNHENTELLAQVSELYNQAGFQDIGQALVNKSKQEVIELNNRGVVMAKEGKLDEAIKLLSDARTMLPNNKRIMINLVNMAILSMRQSGRNDYLMQLSRECVEQVAKLDRQEEWCAQVRAALDAIPATE
ncbi:MAG: tetratricopeptide repeat protein [Gallionella sp.]|nr:tetratricopeptide repeat protein [Gallionella sp.]